jgi:hypothetical protein
MMHRKDHIIKRLRYLWRWELFDSFFFPALVIVLTITLDKPVGLFTIASAGLVTWLLWQGAAYWWLKLRAVQSNAEIAPQHLRRFATLQNVNWALIGLVPVVLAILGIRGGFFRSSLDVVAGLGLYTLAVLEQINYYHYQLMYDCASDVRYLVAHKRLKCAKL